MKLTDKERNTCAALLCRESIKPLPYRPPET